VPFNDTVYFLLLNIKFSKILHKSLIFLFWENFLYASNSSRFGLKLMIQVNSGKLLGYVLKNKEMAGITAVVRIFKMEKQAEVCLLPRENQCIFAVFMAFLSLCVVAGLKN
jgi:hypothetical protein